MPLLLRMLAHKVRPKRGCRYWRASRQPGSDEVLELAPPAEPVGHGKTSKLVRQQDEAHPCFPATPPPFSPPKSTAVHPLETPRLAA